MFNLEQWLYSLITSDTTLQNLLKSPSGSTTTYSVYPAGVDLVPENFPAITYQDVGSTIISSTHMHIGRMQLDVWSKTNMNEVMTIYTRLAQVINFQHSRIATVNFNGILWWIREELTNDRPDVTRRLWRKMITYKYWENTVDNS